MLSPILQAARDILEGAGRKGLPTDEITRIAIEQNKNCGLDAEQFKAKLQAALLANVKLKRTTPTFAQVNWTDGKRKGKPRQGWYRLKQSRSTPAPPPLPTTTTTAFTGKGGEYAVMSELLFWGFNASIMTVDDGVDIVASKDGKFFLIQVKTATPKNDGKFSFTIKRSSFQRYQSSDPFYILVMRNEQINYFLVIPNKNLQYFCSTGSIGFGDTLALTVTKCGAKFLLNGREDITPFFGNFAIIQ